MASESARATSAAESRYRIDAPNAQPRTVKVIALDAAAERVVKRIAQGPWRRATFFTVVMVAAAGGSPPTASVIGEACALNRVMTTALIVDAHEKSDAALARTLSCLRPYASMLVVADGEDYIEAMLEALRA
jgi:hypothetical protein